MPPTPQLLPKVEAATLASVLLTSPSANLIPGPANSITAVAGNVVTFTATGASSAAGTSCSVTGAPSNVVTNVLAEVSTGTNVFGAFTVGTGPSGPGGAGYTLTITCGPDSGTAILTVKPLLTVTPPIGFIHTLVTVTVNGFPSDATGPCTITGGAVYASPQSCTIGSGSASGTFIANPAAANGTAIPITVTVVGGVVTGSTPSSSFEPVVGNDNGHPGAIPTAIMSLTSAPAGYGTISLNGGGFHLGSTRACTLSATGAALPLFSVSSPPCLISANGTLTGSFTVNPTVLTGVDTLHITDASTPTCTGGCNPFGASTFTVVAGPGAAGAPSTANGVAGTFVTVGATVNPFGGGTNGIDAGGCAISSSPAALSSSSFCVTDNSGNILLASFQVSATALGQGYTLTVTGSHGDPSTASSTFTVKPAVTVVSPSPFQGSPPLGALPGTTVIISGTGFEPSDTGTPACSITPAPATLSISGLTCSVNIATGALSASFVVGATSVFVGGGYTLTVAGNPSGDTPALAPPKFFVEPSIVLNPTFGPGTTVVSISGSGFANGGGAACTTGVTSNIGLSLFNPIAAPPCTDSATGVVVGSFTVSGLVPDASYTVTVTGTAAGDVASKPFTKGAVVTTTTTTSAPTITLNPFAGVVGTVVSISGNGFASGDVGTYVTNCLSSTPSPDIIIAPTCTFTSGGSMSGSFTVVASAALGAHSIRVTGSTSDFASATFTVTTGPTLTLAPTGGQTGITVQATVSGFAPTDTIIAFTSSPSALFSTPLTCTPISGACSTTFTVTGTPGSYQVIATGTPVGDSASTVFNAGTGDAFLTMNPPEGPPGTLVSVSGNIPFAGDSSCSIGGGTGNGIGTNTWSCTIVATTSFTHTSFAGSFVVSNLSPGAYSVRVSGSGGNTVSSATTITNAQNYVEATFIVTGPKIILTPNSGRIGITVIIGGSGFSFADNTCTLSVQQGSSSINQNGACSIGGGTGTPSASFTVGNVVPGTYVLRVTGSTSDFAEATFTVVSGPTITLLPTTGPPGTNVIVTGSGFLPQDSTCSISGTPVQNPACSITVGSGAPAGSFQVSAVASGAYTVTVSASSGGDSAQAVFTVTVQTLSLTLNPTYGSPSMTVTFVGLGLGSTDTSCTLTSTPSTPTNGASLIASPSCSVSGGTATGSFVVNTLATTDGSPWTVTVTGNPVSDHLTAQFTVVPAVGVTPTGGTFGTVVTIFGNAFSSKATTCSLASAPAGLFASGTSACTVTVPGPNGNGQISGTFTVATSIPAGAYVVTAKDDQGKLASTTFTVGTPTAQLTLSPNSLLPPTSGTVTVAVTGFAFNPVDTGCSVAVSTPITVAGTCSMSGGSASATLNVPSGAASGLYLVTVTGSPNGDFASNYLAVGAITTATSTTSTTTASTTLTSTSTTTTSTNLFTSQSTTTLQTTGFSTWIFTSRTATTTSAVTTASSISTIFSTSIFMTTFVTTVRTTFTSTLGQIIQPAVSDGVLPTSFGLVALLLLAVPFLLRRLTD